MFYGPVVGGLITQHLSFEWAATVQGGLAFLAVSITFMLSPQLSIEKRTQLLKKHRGIAGELNFSFDVAQNV